MTQRQTYTVHATVPVRVTLTGITTQTPEQAISMADAMIGETASTVLKHDFRGRGDHLLEVAKLQSTNPLPLQTRFYCVDPNDSSSLDLSHHYERSRNHGVVQRVDTHAGDFNDEHARMVAMIKRLCEDDLSAGERAALHSEALALVGDPVDDDEGEGE